MIRYEAPKAAGTIPVIDLSASFGDDGAARQAAATAIRRAAFDTGFFYVSGHGVAPETIDAMTDRSRAFFALPVHEKAKVDYRLSGNNRGYEPPASQTLDEGSPPDLKESFMLGRELGPDHPYVIARFPAEGANIWPSEPAGFRAAGEAYLAAMIALGRHLAGLIALSLEVAEDHFAEALAEPGASVRLLRYPPQPAGAEANQLGAGAHTDWGFVTILHQDAIGGLEVQNRDGAWIAATPIPGAFVVNLGDMMPQLTGGLYRSTPHRVRNNSGAADRYSIATFFNPGYDYEFECLPSCREGASAVPRRSFGQHIREMFERSYGAAA